MKIDKDIPIPSTRKWKGKYNFDLLNDSGDSIFIDINPSVTYSNIRQAAYQFSRSNGFKVVTRKMEDGVRIWRV